jgi:hypothetical protein
MLISPPCWVVGKISGRPKYFLPYTPALLAVKACLPRFSRPELSYASLSMLDFHGGAGYRNTLIAPAA